MIDLLRRLRDILFGTNVPRIDYWLLAVDVLVLVVIVWFEGLEIWHRRQLRRRVASLIPYMDAGQTIQRELQELAPEIGVSGGIGEAGLAWMIEANDWSRTTEGFLALHSTRASAAFLLVVNMGGSDRNVYTPKYGTVRFVGELGDCYQTLLTRLDNLRRIIEKPEAYF